MSLGPKFHIQIEVGFELGRDPNFSNEALSFLLHRSDIKGIRFEREIFEFKTEDLAKAKSGIKTEDNGEGGRHRVGHGCL